VTRNIRPLIRICHARMVTYLRDESMNRSLNRLERACSRACSTNSRCDSSQFTTRDEFPVEVRATKQPPAGGVRLHRRTAVGPIKALSFSRSCSCSCLFPAVSHVRREKRTAHQHGFRARVRVHVHVCVRSFRTCETTEPTSLSSSRVKEENEHEGRTPPEVFVLSPLQSLNCSK